MPAQPDPPRCEFLIRAAVISLSQNGEITDQEWDILTEKNKPVDEVRDFSLLREAQKELKLK